MRKTPVKSQVNLYLNASPMTMSVELETIARCKQSPAKGPSQTAASEAIKSVSSAGSQHKHMSQTATKRPRGSPIHSFGPGPGYWGSGAIIKYPNVAYCMQQGARVVVNGMCSGWR